MSSSGPTGALHKWRHVSALDPEIGSSFVFSGPDGALQLNGVMSDAPKTANLDRRMCSRGAKGPFINGVTSGAPIQKSDRRSEFQGGA